MKKILIPLIALLFMSSITIANDCEYVGNGEDSKATIIKNWNKDNILPQDAIEIAVKNLQKFCCTEESLKTELGYCDISKDWDFPSSAYLYDHILDVSLRRLDAKVDNKNWENLMYWLSWDPQGKSWREFITEHGNSSNGSVPVQIVDEFKKNREIKSNLLNWMANHDMPWWDDKFNNYKEWTLWEKYARICETSVYLYLGLIPNADKAKLDKAYKNCKSLINTRIKNEYDYTKAILMQKWNKLLHVNIKTYLDSYFSQDKMTELQQLIFNIKNTFNEVNKAVIKLVPNCG